MAGPAADPGTLRADLGRLQAELDGLSRCSWRRRSTRPADRGPEVELSRLEEQLRQLTGRIEEVEFAQRQPGQRIDQLVADLDARLGRWRVRAASARRRSRPTRRPRAPRRPRTAQPPSIAPDAAARQGHVLGTIPEDALRGQPGPDSRPAGAEHAAGQQAGWSRKVRMPPTRARSICFRPATGAAAEQSFSAFVKDYPRRFAGADAPPTGWARPTSSARTTRPRPRCSRATTAPTAQTAPRAPDNLLKLGMSLAAMGDRDKACQTFAELAKRHPECAGADQAGR